MKNKILFTINVNHTIDLITNSSSELFVLQGSSLDNVKEMLKSTYEDYLSEYEEVVLLKDATTDQVETYLYQNYRGSDYNLPDSIEGIGPEILWKNWNTRNEVKYYYKDLTDEGAKLLVEKIDPDNQIYLLFSIDENPNWDNQEKLMDIGTRHHLG